MKDNWMCFWLFAIWTAIMSGNYIQHEDNSRMIKDLREIHLELIKK